MENKIVDKQVDKQIEKKDDDFNVYLEYNYMLYCETESLTFTTQKTYEISDPDQTSRTVNNICPTDPNHVCSTGAFTILKSSVKQLDLLDDLRAYTNDELRNYVIQLQKVINYLITK